MASGIPSSLAHRAATAGAFSSVKAKPGTTALARSTKSLTASYRNNVAAARARPGSGSESGGTGHETSPATPRGSRLVASKRRPGQARRRTSARGAHPSSTCSQLSRTTSVSLGPRYSTSSSALVRPGDSATPRAEATLLGTRSASESDARSTHGTPSPKDPPMSSATLRASRVFPEPPAPTRVRRRTRPRSLSTSASSRSRPTKLVVSSGRLPPDAFGPSPCPPATSRSESSVRARILDMIVTSSPKERVSSDGARRRVRMSDLRGRPTTVRLGDLDRITVTV
jgi:hypothetical protein